MSEAAETAQYASLIAPYALRLDARRALGLFEPAKKH
jgi:hypothetical protein